MRKLALGAGMAVTAVFGLGEVAPAQDANPLCAPVYDETLTGDSSGTLRQQLNEFETEGTDAHVQIIEDGRPYDIEHEGEAGRQDAEDFREELAHECGWNNSSQVNVLVSADPRVFEIYRKGPLERINSRVYEDAEGDFIENLRDSSTPFQSDVASLLETLDSATEATSPPSQEIGEPEEPSEPVSIPYKTIALSVLGVGALLGTAGRLYRGRQLRLVKNRALSHAEGVSSDLSQAVVGAGEVLGVVDENDAMSLREADSKGWSLQSDINGRTEAFGAVYKKQRRRFWPSLLTVESEADLLQEKAGEAAEQSQIIIDGTEELQNDILTIDQQIDGFSKNIDALKGVITNLQAEGWDVSVYQGQINELEAKLAEARQLRAEKFVDKPSTITEEETPKLEVFSKKLTELPLRLQAAQQQLISIQETHPSLSLLTDTAVALLTSLAERHHSTCTDDIKGVSSDISDVLGRLSSLQQAIDAAIGEAAVEQQGKSAASVETAEQALDQWAEAKQRLQELNNTVVERERRIESLQETLPGRIDALGRNTQEVERYIFEQHTSDVEDETRTQFRELEAQIKQFESSADGLQSEKPAYLEIDRTLARFEAEAARIQGVARGEKEEMDHLRGQVSSLERQAESELADLEAYISRHSSDISGSTRAAAGEIGLFNADPSASRVGLRDQVSDFNRLMDRINAIESSAEADHNRAEAARRRRREEEEAARRRRAASAATFGGGFSSGGSFGGGGSSGGGTSSGGSW